MRTSNVRDASVLLTVAMPLMTGSLSGCFLQFIGSRGKTGTREITDETRVSQIREGTTTKADLLGLFGKPDAEKKTTSPEHGNEEVWVYRYWKFNFRAEPTVAALTIYFNPGDDVVRRVVREVGTTPYQGPPAPPDRPNGRVTQ